jgi:hypothetical protein
MAAVLGFTFDRHDDRPYSEVIRENVPEGEPREIMLATALLLRGLNHAERQVLYALEHSDN